MTPGGIPTSGGIVTGIWIRVGKQYFYSRGADPDGTPRLPELSAPPYGKTVYAYDGHTWTTEHVPFRLRPATLAALALAALTAVVIPLLLTGRDPIIAQAFTPAAVGALLLLAYLAQVAPLRPHDAISRAETARALYEADLAAQQQAAVRAAQQQANAARTMQQWAAAQWAQQAAINQSLNPDQDVYRPYGQSPPL